MKATLSVLFIVCAAFLSFGCWKLERWINWRLDYSSKVEIRIQTLERRITALERGHTIENGIETCRNNKCGICNR